MRKTNILLFCSALAGLILYFTGKYLMRLYGLDPPLIYYTTGGILILASMLRRLLPNAAFYAPAQV